MRLDRRPSVDVSIRSLRSGASRRRPRADGVSGYPFETPCGPGPGMTRQQFCLDMPCTPPLSPGLSRRPPAVEAKSRKSSRGVPRGLPLSHHRRRQIYLRACPGDYRASPSNAGLPHRVGLISGFCSSAPGLASGFLPTPPRGGAVAFGSWFPSPGSTEDLHLQ